MDSPPELRDARPVLVLRHPTFKPEFYRVILRWFRIYLPAYRPLLDVRDLPFELPRGARYGAMVPWLQDPVQHWSMDAYEQALRLQAQCDDAGIPVLNRVERLTHAGKCEGARRIAMAGVATPRTVLVTDAQQFRRNAMGLPLPLFVREDWGHNTRLSTARTRDDVQAIPLEEYQRPVASAFVNVRSADGLYYKYRYFAAGDAGITQHVQVSETWMTRGEFRVKTDVTREAELAYIARPDPFHARFQGAVRALGLDMVALDYGLLRDGQPVVWEANPYAYMTFSTKSLVYRNLAIHRSMAAVARLYLRTAGIAVPQWVDDLAMYRGGEELLPPPAAGKLP